MDILCLVRNINCQIGTDPFATVSSFASWIEIVGIFAFLFAGAEFMNRNKTLKHLFFYKSKVPTIVAALALVSILLIVFSNLLPLIREVNSYPLPQLPKTFLLPAFWEIIGLIVLTPLVTFLFLISILPRFRNWLLISKYTSRNYKDFIEEISYLVKFRDDSGELQQLAISILFSKNNLKNLLDKLNFKRNLVSEITEEQEYLSYLFNTILSDKKFIRLLTHKDKHALLTGRYPVN